MLYIFSILPILAILTTITEEFITNYGLIGLFFISFIGTSFIPIPIEIAVLMANGLGFNWLDVGLVAGIGSGLGSLINYGIGYYGGEAVITKLIQKKKKGKEKRNKKDLIKETKKVIDKYGFWGIVVIALTPIPFDIATLCSGLFRYDVKKFLMASLLGRIPRFLIIAYFGEIALKFFLI